MATPQDFLNRLQIASPCPADWAAMEGDDRARFCGQCEKHVYDFSKMTAAEGMALIREKEGKICGRLWRRADGTVITADCPVGARTLLARREAKLPLAAAALAALSLSTLACAPKMKPQATPSPAPTPRPQATMTTTFDYSGPVPAANVVLTERYHGVETCEVGSMVDLTMGFPPDMNTTTQGMRVSREDWEHLPIR